MGRTALNIIRKTISACIAEGIASVVKNTLIQSAALGPAAIPLAGIAGGGAAALFNSVIPKFAAGGVAFGPTVGMFGEYANARTNPEVVAPLDKLKGLIGGGNEMSLKPVRIDNRYIYMAWERENEFRGRT